MDVPPGYTDFYGLHGNSKYYNYTLNENGELKHFGNQEQEYLTDVLVSGAIQFDILMSINVTNLLAHSFREILVRANTR